MTMGITLEYSQYVEMTSSTTVNLMTGGCIVADGYYPKTPGETDGTVVEEIPLWLIGTGSEMLAIIRGIEKALELAAASERNWVYLNFQLDATQTSYRSRVWGGSVIYDGRLDRRWRRGRMKAVALVRRDVVWEGPETALSVANQHGSGTSGVTVHWRCDSTHDNWVEVDAAAVVGDLPGPTKITIALDSSSTSTSEIYIHNGWRWPVATPLHILEGEDSTGGTDAADADYSGGGYTHATVTEGIDDRIVQWILDEDVTGGPLLRLKGDLGRFVLVGRKSGSGVDFDLWAWLVIKDYAGAHTLWTGPRVAIGEADAYQIYDLGVANMPPGFLNVGKSYHQLDFYVYTDVASQDMEIDFLAVCPVDSAAYMTTYNLSNTHIMTNVVDGFTQRHYTQDASDTRVMRSQGAWGFIYLQPGVDNRIYFNFRRQTAAGDAAGTASVKVWYRPRRRTL